MNGFTQAPLEIAKPFFCVYTELREYCIDKLNAFLQTVVTRLQQLASVFRAEQIIINNIKEQPTELIINWCQKYVSELRDHNLEFTKENSS